MTDVTGWTLADVRGTLRAAEDWWRLLADGHLPLVAEEAGRARAALEGLASGEVDEAAAVQAFVDAVLRAGRVLHAEGVPPVSGEGVVVQLNRSDGGVPKRPVDRVQVGVRGVVGDRQAARRHHGRAWQALCLWSAEVIDRLAAEGHPIGPGRAGENVTISGLDWAEMRPGVRLRIGSVLAETALWSLPCSKNAQWFLDGDFQRMHHERERGVSRIYAWVLEPGHIAVGDPVVVEP